MSNPNDGPAHNRMTAVVCHGLLTSQDIVTHGYPIGEWDEAIRVANPLESIKIPLKAAA